ncbi:MAG: ankyrin repeat domain-containing protein [Wolbachia endosymbiont of Xenopsylla cheopis]
MIGLIPNPKNELFDAVSTSNVEEIVRVLELGVDPNIKSDSGQAPIHIAAFSAESYIIMILSEFGANINIQNKAGDTALHIAISTGNKDMVGVLLMLKAKVNLKNASHMLPIHLAALHGSPMIIELLCQNKADINIPDNDGNTALHLVVCGDSIDKALTLIRLGAKINTKNKYGLCPLHSAVFYGNVDMVALLCDNGAHVNEIDSIGRTALALSAYHNLKDIAQLLLKYNACSGIADKDGNLPIHLSIQPGKDPIIVEILLEANDGSLRKKNNDGFIPLHLAVKCQNVDAVEMLLHYSYIEDIGTAFTLATQIGNIFVEQLLLKYIKISNVKNNTEQISNNCVLPKENDLKKSSKPVLSKSFKKCTKSKLNQSNSSSLKFLARKCKKLNALRVNFNTPDFAELVTFKNIRYTPNIPGTTLSQSWPSSRSSVAGDVPSSGSDKNSSASSLCRAFVDSLDFDKPVYTDL